MTGFSAANDELGIRLQKVADLLSRSGPLPEEPVLIWQESAGAVQHAVIRDGMVVGRQAGEGGLTFAKDNFLGRQHFAIRHVGPDFFLEDLKSRNGTAINDAKIRIKSRLLRDGDIIFAGNHIFVFLCHRAGS